MKVIIASDHGGINIRKEIMALMDELNIEYEDYGCECGSGSVDYPDYAFPVAQKVADGGNQGRSPVHPSQEHSCHCALLSFSR